MIYSPRFSRKIFKNLHTGIRKPTNNDIKNDDDDDDDDVICREGQREALEIQF